MVSKIIDTLLPCKYCYSFPKLSLVDMSSPSSIEFYYKVSCPNVNCDHTVNSHISIFDAIKNWNDLQLNKENTDFHNSNIAYYEQLLFCRRRNLPVFSPRICYHCGRDIYEVLSVDEASLTHITHCPLCQISFCD